MSTLLRTNAASASKVIAGLHPGATVPQFPPPSISKTVNIVDKSDDLLTRHSLQNAITLQSGAIFSTFSGPRAIKGVTVIAQRQAHSDVQFPNLEHYRPDTTKNPYKPTSETEDDRKTVPNAIIYGVGGVLGVYAAKTVVQGLVSYKGMSAAQMALANIEVNLADIPEGKCKTYEWRGKPVFVRHRTHKEVEEVRAVDVSSLRHPEKDEERTKKPEWSVLIGICTHLGCVPFAGMGDFGGYYCPCHGSHYDASGRIRKGPAPLNLHIPDHDFLPGDKLKVG